MKKEERWLREIESLFGGLVRIVVGGKKRKLPKKKLPKVTYRREMVRNGKSNKLYGPYWYAYYKKDGRLHKKYLGKQRREVDVE